MFTASRFGDQVSAPACTNQANSSTTNAIKIADLESQLPDLEGVLEYEKRQLKDMLQVFLFTGKFLDSMINDAARAETTGEILAKPPHPRRLSSKPNQEMVEAWEKAEDHAAYIIEMTLLQVSRDFDIESQELMLIQLNDEIKTVERKLERLTGRLRLSRLGLRWKIKI